MLSAPDNLGLPYLIVLIHCMLTVICNFISANIIQCTLDIMQVEGISNYPEQDWEDRERLVSI